MRREQDLTVRAQLAIAAWRPSHALRGHDPQADANAACGGMGRWLWRPAAGASVRLIAATVCVLSVLGCGDERPPWSGFPIFPPDAGGPELSPELTAGLLAAQEAFVRQLSGAGQGALDAGNLSSSATSPNVTRRPSAGAAAPSRPSDDENEAEQDTESAPSSASSGGANAGVQIAATDAGAPVPDADGGTD